MTDSFQGIISANFGESLSDLPPVGETISQSQDPDVTQLYDQIQLVLNKINAFGNDAVELSKNVNDLKNKKKSYIDEVNKIITSMESDIHEVEKRKKEIDNSIKEAQYEKDKLLADLDHLEEAKKANQLLQEARDRWRKIIAEHDWLWAKSAREYQQVGIEFIASALDRGLFGIALLDEMGLGKTLQARGAVDLMQNHPRFEGLLSDRLNTWSKDTSWTSSILWVCPDSIKESTKKELAKWSDAPVVVLEGDSIMRKHLVNMTHQAGVTLVVGYKQIRDRSGEPVTPELFDHEWPIVVADEIQEARNESSSTFKNVRDLVNRAAFFVPMSGTPVENKPVEFWVTLHLLTQKGKRQGEFPTSSRFENMYLYSDSQQFQHGAFERLMKSVSDMALRRTKKEVEIELPDKTRSIRFVKLTGRQRELYDQMRDRLIVWLDEQKSEAVSATNFLAQLTRLRQINLIPSGVKVKDADGIEHILDCDESAKLDDAMGQLRLMTESDEKCIVAANFNHALYHTQKLVAQENLTWTDKKGRTRVVETAAITGDISGAKRSIIQDRFNDPDDDLRIVVGNIQAMGLGLNLQGACSQMIFLDLYWNPSRNLQTEDRLHRMGQKNSVNIQIIQAEETVDAFIAEIIEKKAGTFEAMFERDVLRNALDRGLI